MLFSIYIASLIVLSNGMALERREKSAETACNLVVYVGGLAKGWVRKADIHLTTDPNFSKAQKFLLVGDSSNAVLPTLRIDDNQVVALDSDTKRSLTIRKPDEQGIVTPAWVNPYYQDPDQIRPTELLLNNPGTDQFTKLQYCTHTQKGTVILQAAVGDSDYSCEDATVIVRKFYKKTIYTLPQKAKIGVYREDNLSFLGWLLLDKSNYVITTEEYGSADNYSLFGGIKQININLGGKYFIWTGNDDVAVLKKQDMALMGKDMRAVIDFMWVDGNPHNLGALNQDWGLYMCPADPIDLATDYLKIGKKDSEDLRTCVKVVFFISATG